MTSDARPRTKDGAPADSSGYEGHPIRWQDLSAPASLPNSLGWRWAARNVLGMGPYLLITGFIVAAVVLLFAPGPLVGLVIVGAVATALVVGAAGASLRLAQPMTPRWVAISGEKVTVGGWRDRSLGPREFPLSDISAVRGPGWITVGQGKGVYWAYTPYVIEVEGTGDSTVPGVRELRRRSFNLSASNAERLQEAFRTRGLAIPRDA